MEIIFELLFGIIHWLFGSLFSGGTHREVKALQAKYSHAKETGVPLVCDLPASLRIYQPSKRGRRHGKWTRGILHVQATSLIWEPQPGEQGRSWDLTTATIIRKVPPIGGSSQYRQGRNLVMQSGHHFIELHIRQPFLPFLRAGQEQAAGRIALSARGDRARSCSWILSRPVCSGYSPSASSCPQRKPLSQGRNARRRAATPISEPDGRRPLRTRRHSSTEVLDGLGLFRR